MSKGIEVSRAAGAQVIRINRPDKKNALSSVMYLDLVQALEEGDAAAGVAAHVVLGAHGVFTAGNDLADFLSFGKDGSSGAVDNVMRFVETLPRVKKPLIAGVDGLAVGVGVTMLALNSAGVHYTTKNMPTAVLKPSPDAATQHVGRPYADKDHAEYRVVHIRKGEIAGAIPGRYLGDAEGHAKYRTDLPIARESATMDNGSPAPKGFSAPQPQLFSSIIEGIGPKLEELLNQHGIYTFAQLADTEVPELETIIRGAGSRFQTAVPDTWPRQARLAANREWPRLDALKAELHGGVRRPNAVEVAAVAAVAAAADAAEQAQQPPPSDDLTIIEGIGPKIQELLNQHDIDTFARLADAEVPDLEAILRSGGSRFQTANPETWPRQARLAANREWPRLDALKAQLQGGVRRAPVEPQDDLAVIEGIGPKIADVLYQNGIKTYAQLARMEPARLRLLLDEAGPAYRMADPTSWPEQASWAAVGNWGRLQTLKDELDAGRRQA